jgi:hypothetical protein
MHFNSLCINLHVSVKKCTYYKEVYLQFCQAEYLISRTTQPIATNLRTRGPD